MCGPAFLERFTDVEGVGPAVGLTYAYPADTRNLVKLRQTSVQVHGLTASPLSVVYPDLTDMVGGEAAFQRMFAEPDAIVLTAGFAEYLDVGIGDTVTGQGRGAGPRGADAHRGAGRAHGRFLEHRPQPCATSAGAAAPAFVSMDTFLRLTNDPNQEHGLHRRRVQRSRSATRR